MSQCAGITAVGERCKGQAIGKSEYCFSHSPDHVEARKQRASKGGKRGGRGRPGADIAELKRDVRSVIDDVLEGKVLQGPGAVALQGYNVLLRASKLELEIREQQDIIERVTELESMLERQNKGKRWGA